MENSRIAINLRRSVLPYIRRRAFMFDAGALVFAVLLSRVNVLSAAYPFGIALIAGADMASRNVYYPFFGVVIGALIVGSYANPALICAILYTVIRLFYPLVVKRFNRVDKLLVLGASLAVTLPIYYAGSWLDFLRGISGASFALLLSICYFNAFRALKGVEVKQKLHEEEQIAICILIGSLALSVSDIRVYSFSLGVVVVVWTTMFIAYAKGLSAVAAAVTLGSMLLLCSKVHPILLADLAICALAAAAGRSAGIWGVCFGFLVCCGVTEIYLGIQGQQIGMINAVPAAAAIVLIPKRGQLYLRSLLDSGAKEERTARAILSRIQSNTAEEIARAVNTVEEVAMLFPESVAWVHNPDRERADMERAALHICGECTYRGSCWREKPLALDAVEAMLAAHAQGIRPRAEEPLKSDCPHTVSIAAAAAQARDAYREKCMQAYRAATEQSFVNRQLLGVGSVMRKLSTDIKGSSWPDETSAVLLQRRLERDGIAVNNIVVRQKRNTLFVEMRLPKGECGQRRTEEAVSRALERRMRILSVRETSRETIYELEPAQRMKADFGAATLPKRGCTLSGDSTGSISLPNGQMLYVLSDGMGSGAEAHDQSMAAVNMLMKLYGVGYERDIALECVNRVLINKGGGELYATLDALHVDLKTGSAEFIKCGATPSFVLREGKVHTIYAEALPAGVIDEAPPAVHTAKLKQNDSVVMLTDGALDALSDETEDAILISVGGANTCEDAANALLKQARQKGAKDDMTVMVVRLE